MRFVDAAVEHKAEEEEEEEEEGWIFSLHTFGWLSQTVRMYPLFLWKKSVCLYHIYFQTDYDLSLV